MAVVCGIFREIRACVASWAVSSLGRDCGVSGFVGALWDYDVYVYQGAARAQALRPLLVRFWLAPPISRRNRAMLTNVAAEGLAVCLKMIRRGSKPEAPDLRIRMGRWGVTQCRKLGRFRGREDGGCQERLPPVRVSDGRGAVVW